MLKMGWDLIKREDESVSCFYSIEIQFTAMKVLKPTRTIIKSSCFPANALSSSWEQHSKLPLTFYSESTKVLSKKQTFNNKNHSSLFSRETRNGKSKPNSVFSLWLVMKLSDEFVVYMQASVLFYTALDIPPGLQLPLQKSNYCPLFL